jgi:predicted TPR repeat methyltransferase
LDLQPGMRNIAISYGHLLYRLNRLAEAVEFYARWQSSAPDDPIPRHMLAAMGGAERPTRASDGYVRATFDDFADSFDRNLEELGYRAPQLLFDTVMRANGAALPLTNGPEQAPTGGPALPLTSRPAQPPKWDVLDVGCGTGLCGALWRPLSRRLVGVDLSPNMLSKAAARAVYDQLNCAELTEWLSTCGQRFDLAVAADVLCYFGDLSAAFEATRSVLLPGGCFACSLEAMPDSAPVEEPFVLLPHGRYQHRRNYVEAMLSASGLELQSISTETLRYERQESVIGLVVIARRTDYLAS